MMKKSLCIITELLDLQYLMTNHPAEKHIQIIKLCFIILKSRKFQEVVSEKSAKSI